MELSARSRKLKVIGAVILVAIVASALTWYAARSISPSKFDEVSLSTAWILQGRDVGIFISEDKGYYTQSGIKILTISRGYGGLDAAKKLAAGTFALTMPTLPDVITGVSQGMKIRAIMAQQDLDPVGFVSLKRNGIATPRDIAGKTLGMASGTSTAVMWPIICKNFDICGKVKVDNIRPDVYVPALLAGKVDLVPEYQSSGYPEAVLAARKVGEELNAIWTRDHGLNLYNIVLASTDQMMEKNPDLVRRFVLATVKGYVYAFEHMDEGVSTMIRYHPEFSDRREGLKLELIETLRMGQTKTFRDIGFGWFDDAKVKENIAIISEGYKIARPPTATEVYTNEFLPKIPVPVLAEQSP